MIPYILTDLNEIKEEKCIFFSQISLTDFHFIIVSLSQFSCIVIKQAKLCGEISNNKQCNNKLVLIN